MIRFVALAGLAVAACRPEVAPTEIVITVDTSFGVPCTIDTLRFTVDDGEHEPVSHDAPVTDADLPGSLTVVADGGGDATITVTGLRRGEPFASATTDVTFDREDTLEAQFVLDRSCVPGPCPAIGVGGYPGGLPAPIARRGCGAAGYEIRDDLFAVRDACALSGATHVLADVDETEAMAPFATLPFPFTIYGDPVAGMWVGTNGYLAFTADEPHALTQDVSTPRSLGEPGFPVQAVLPFWDTLRTGAAGVCFAVTGELPDRILWVTWKDACFAVIGNTPCGAPDRGALTFTVALEETSDRIHLGYQSMVAAPPNGGRAHGNAATIGVVDAVTPACGAVDCSATGECTAGGACNYTEFSSNRQLDPMPALELVPR